MGRVSRDARRILRLNKEYRALLSNDLGAIVGLLFDVGNGRYSVPRADDDETARRAWEADLERVRDAADRDRKKRQAEQEGDRTHTEIQCWLRDLGRALGFDVWIAANDRAGRRRKASSATAASPTSRPRFRQCLVRSRSVSSTCSGCHPIAATWKAAFEVQHTTSLYSGIVRMLDLPLGVPGTPLRGLFLVAPDEREEDVRAQLRRPAFARVSDLSVRYLPYSELAKYREFMARFGSGLRPIEAVARTLS